MVIRNFTPHTLNFFSADLAGVILELPSEGQVRVACSRKHVGDEWINDSTVGIPIMRSTFGALEGLPEELHPADKIVVSRLAAEAIREQKPELLKQVLVVDQTVRRDEAGNLNLKDGAIVGALSLAVL